MYPHFLFLVYNMQKSVMEKSKKWNANKSSRKRIVFGSTGNNHIKNIGMSLNLGNK